MDELKPLEETKTCTKCALVRPSSAFSKREMRSGAISIGRVCSLCKGAATVAALALKKAAAPEFAVTSGTKVCRVCHETLPLIKFQHRLGVEGNDLYNGACNPCTRGPGVRARKKAAEEATGLRICASCKTSQPLSKFNLGATRPIYCAACRKSRSSENWTKQKPAYAKRDPRIRMLSGAKARAAKVGVPFGIVISDLFVPEFCPVLGVKLEYGHKGFMHNSPTIDRLVPSEGYVRGNIAVISGRANRLKNDGTAEEHERVAAWMRSQGLK